MTESIFPSKFAPTDPKRIQLYSLATPNGQKAGVMLEESGLPYDAHRINIMEGDQFDPEYVAINPNSKIPALLDPQGPDGKPIRLMESAAILLYVAKKSGKLYPKTEREMSETLQWLFFQMASVGPMFGQFGHFYKFAKGKTDAYGEQRYGKEVTRLLGVLDKHLAGRDFLVGQYGLADISTVPWVNALDFYEGKDAVGYETFKNVHSWVGRVGSRPAFERGIKVCAFA